MREIIKWTVLRDLDKDFINNSKLVYVFGKKADKVLVITNDDNVYAFGSNHKEYGILGLGHTDDAKQPKLIEELRDKQVIKIEISFDYDYVLALTKTGEVYSWGNNSDGQLSIGNRTDQFKPVIIEDLSDENVIDIKAGFNFSLALTQFGDVFKCGYKSRLRPIKLNINYEAKNKIISIACGCEHALALTINGDIFGWGCNTDGQIGNGNNTSVFCNKWSPIQLYNTRITKIVCGSYHSMVLFSDGKVYCFGSNKYGQCGDGSNINRNIPINVNINERVKDIAVSNHINVCITANNICYVWGKCGKESVNTPTKTHFIDINEAIVSYLEVKVPYRPICLNEVKTNKPNLLIVERIQNSFDKQEFSDIAFKVNNRLIYANKSYLSIVCNHFKMMFSDNNWIESNKSEIKITQYSYNVYYAFLKYLYTNVIDKSISYEDLVEFVDLANCYLEEELKQEFIKLLKTRITIDNVCKIYSLSLKYNLNELKDYCIDMFSTNMKDKSIAESYLNGYANK